MKDLTEIIKNAENDKLRQLLSDDATLAAGTTEQGISFLQFAAYCRNSEAIAILKQYKKVINIFEAACTGELNTVEKILTSNPHLLNTYAADGFTAIGLASFFGHFPIVKFLLEKGADPNLAANNSLKVTPLHSACAISHFEIAEILINYDANVNAKQMQGVSPLHSAAHNGNLGITKLLIEHGAEINAKMDNGQTPLFMAKEKGFKAVSDFIISNGGV